MKCLASALSAALLLASGAGSARADEEFCSDPSRRDLVSCRQFVVEYDPAPGAFDWRGLMQAHQLEVIGILPELDQAWFVAPAGRDIQTLAAEVALWPGVIETEMDGEFVPPECRQLNAAVVELGPSGAPLFLNQPALRTVHARTRPGLGFGVTIAVLDTGVSRAQTELRGVLVPRGLNYQPGGGGPLADDIGNGLDDDGDLTVDDGVGHGTAVAGLIHLLVPAARILPVRVLDDECRGSAFALAAGIVGAVNQGASVLNLSFGSLDGSSVIVKALRWARARGAIVVSPAGNEGLRELQFPAEEDEVLGVAGVDDSLRAAAWTNYGDRLDFSAPGVDIVSTRRGSYARMSGTSFSTAFVSAAAAMVVAVRPALDLAGVNAVLQQYAIPVDPWNPGDASGNLGAGIPDLGRLAWLTPWAPARPPVTRRSLGALLPGLTGGSATAHGSSSPAEP